MTTLNAASPIILEKQKFLDRVCGMEADPSAPAATLLNEGTTYLFCSTHCLEKFKASPGSFTGAGKTKPEQTNTLASESNLNTNTFTCPMHPEILQEGPGPCPKCGMALEPLIAPAPAERVEYTCPMHPEIVQDTPGPCPKCGMALEPRTVIVDE